MTVLTRDQERARLAYESVGIVVAQHKEIANDYRGHVNGFGAAVMRNGLAAALAFLERDKGKDRAASLFLSHLAKAELPGVQEATTGETLFQLVRSLPVEKYMLVTREMLALAIWFRRAVQAMPKGKS